MVSSSLESTLEATESALALDAALAATFPPSRAAAGRLRESAAAWAGDVDCGAANAAGRSKQAIRNTENEDATHMYTHSYLTLLGVNTMAVTR